MTSVKHDLRAYLFLTLQLHHIPQWLGMRHWGVGSCGILLFPGLEISLTCSVHGWYTNFHLLWRCLDVHFSLLHKAPPFYCLTQLSDVIWTKKCCSLWRKPGISPGYLFFECFSPLTNADRISVPGVLLASSRVLPNKYITLEDDFQQLPGKLQWCCQLISHMLLSDRYQTKWTISTSIRYKIKHQMNNTY